ncbi:MAG: AbrB/MazE/SpoVT family DNA-binding domain-containing protein [Candidatus Micrarchaeota archaeon]
MYFIEQRKYVIALDSKARLVLPLEIREALGIETNGKIIIRIASGSWPVASSQKPGANSIIIELAKASDSDMANGRKFSRNCAYLRYGRCRGGKND